MKQVYDAEFFDGKCPYTSKPCYEWECNSCEVDAQEKKDMEELDKADKEQEDNGFFDEIMDDESEDREVYEKIKEIIDKVKEQEE